MSRRHKLRVGAFGVGRMGRVHLENLIRLAQQDKIDLVAIGDRFEPTLAAARNFTAELGGIPFEQALTKFSSPETMAAAQPLDAVVIASRTEDHARDSLVFTRLGIPVLVEKPFAGSVVEAVKFHHALGEAGVSR